MNTVIHIGLALVLFLIQNWIGSRSYAKGYIRFSLLDDKDEALSLNYVIKVFGPIVFIILCVAIFQYFNYDSIIQDILNVIYYYLAFRVLLIFLYERAAIVNWIRIAFYYSSILIVSSIIYNNFIDSVENLLPDLSEIKNEIWLLIILFIYQIGNGIEEKAIGNPLYEAEQAFLPELKRRKKRYILRKHKEFKKAYGSVINEITDNESAFNLIMYSILIYENFNRPRIIRLLERIYVKFTKEETTQGIMQSASKKPLSDKESIKKEVKYLFQKYKIYIEEEYPYSTFRKILKRQCPDKKYVRQVLFIAKSIIDNDKENKKYSKIFDEIKSEFRLYDFYD